jgi:DNA-directed RNA polymerase specialized sigma24 family protein
MPPKNPLPRLREIRDAKKALRKALVELDPEQDELIRAAVAQGIPQRRIAVSAGVSKTTVGEIAKKAVGDRPLS